jgi:hypothetical protein
MGLLESAFIAAAIIVLVIAGVIFIYGNGAHAAPLTESRAIQIVGSDIRAGSPAANITLISVSNSSAERNSWNIVYSVAYTFMNLGAFAVVAALRSAHPGTALDVLIPGAVGMLAPPLLAFGVWFGGWHSLRHGARMLAVEPGCAALLAAGRRRAAALRLIRIAAMPSLGALTALAALGWLTAAAPNPNAVLADVLRLLLALTVPHAFVVLWADRSPRDFTPPRRPSPTLSDPHSEGHAT